MLKQKEKECLERSKDVSSGWVRKEEEIKWKSVRGTTTIPGRQPIETVSERKIRKYSPRLIKYI